MAKCESCGSSDQHDPEECSYTRDKLWMRERTFESVKGSESFGDRFRALGLGFWHGFSNPNQGVTWYYDRSCHPLNGYYDRGVNQGQATKQFIRFMRGGW